MSMIVSAIMSLDSGGFTTPLGRVTQGLQTTIRLAGNLSGKLTAAFDMAGELSDLAAQTGELPSTLRILQQAFDDTGVGAASTGQILGLMRKNLSGINDDGSATSKTFARLGLDIDALKAMSANDQLAAIGEKIRALKSPSDQTAAAMEIFGRSGGKMLTFFKDDGALGIASASLGGLPALLDNNANAFDGVSDAIKRIKAKSMGLWAGIAEGALPAAKAITDSLDGIDLTAIGQRIGDILGTVVEMFRINPLGDLIKDALIVGIGTAVNKGAELFLALGDALWQALSGPLADFSAGLGVAIQGAMQKIAELPSITERHPWLKASPLISFISATGEKDGLKGFKAESFDEQRDAALDMLRDLTNGVEDIPPLFDVSPEAENLLKNWRIAAAALQAAKTQITGEANATGPGAGMGGFDLEDASKSKSGGGIGIPTDALARIGGMLGGGGGEKLERLGERQLAVAARQLDALLGIRDKTTGGARWASA